MKITIDHAMRFLQVAVGAGDDRGVMADYFEDLLGLGIPPKVEVAQGIHDWIDQGKSDVQAVHEGRQRIAGLKRFVKALHGLANALDPDLKRPHPNEPDEPVINLDAEDEE